MPDIAEQLDAAIGPAPQDAPPLEPTLALGRRALRRRRTAYGVGAAAAALVIAGTAWAAAPGDDTRRTDGPDFSQEPSRSASADPTERADRPREPAVPWHGEAARVDRAGRLEVRPGWKVTQDLSTPEVVAVEVTKGDRRRWYLFGDAATFSPDGTAPGYATFRAWVDVNIPILLDMKGGRDEKEPAHDWPGVPRDDLVRWTTDGSTLEPVGDVELVEVRTPIDLGASFAAAEETAVAEVLLDGVRWYVVARRTGTEPVYIAVFGDEGGQTLEEFVELARTKYAEGGGGLL